MSHASVLAERQQQRIKRQEWVRELLDEAKHQLADVAKTCGIATRTWRDWIADGVLPEKHKEAIVYVLFRKEWSDLPQTERRRIDSELNAHFSWR